MADDIKSLPNTELVNELVRASINTLPTSSGGNLQEMLRKDDRLRELRAEVLQRMAMPEVGSDGPDALEDHFKGDRPFRGEFRTGED